MLAMISGSPLCMEVDCSRELPECVRFLAVTGLLTRHQQSVSQSWPAVLNLPEVLWYQQALIHQVGRLSTTLRSILIQ